MPSDAITSNGITSNGVRAPFKLGSDPDSLLGARQAKKSAKASAQASGVPKAAMPACARSAGERPRDLDERLQQVDAPDAGVAEEGIERLVGSRERAGMGARERFAQARASELVGDDRLASGVRRARGGRQASGVAHGFEEERD